MGSLMDILTATLVIRTNTQHTHISIFTNKFMYAHIHRVHVDINVKSHICMLLLNLRSLGPESFSK